jgi:aromatic ring hydroxylase
VAGLYQRRTPKEEALSAAKSSAGNPKVSAQDRIRMVRLLENMTGDGAGGIDARVGVAVGDACDAAARNRPRAEKRLAKHLAKVTGVAE